MTTVDEFLVHYGVKGMKWGVRKEDKPFKDKLSKAEKKAYNDEYGKMFEKRWNRSFGLDGPIEYHKLSNDPVTIKKGHELYRVVGKKNLNAPDTYVSTNEQDRNTYRLAMGRSRHHQEITLKATKDLMSPSEKERIDAFISLMDTRSIELNNGKQVTGREYLKKRGYRKEVKQLDSQRLGLAAYNQFAESQWMRDPINTAYFNEVKKRGYNAIVDDNDRNIVSKQPIIVLDTNGSVKRMKITPLTKNDYVQAKREFKAV